MSFWLLCQLASSLLALLCPGRRAHSAGLECENDLANSTIKVAVRPPVLVSLTIHVRQSEAPPVLRRV